MNVVTMSPTRTAPSAQRAADAFRTARQSVDAVAMIAGTMVCVDSMLEKNRFLQTSQYGSAFQPTSATNPASANDETKVPKKVAPSMNTPKLRTECVSWPRETHARKIDAPMSASRQLLTYQQRAIVAGTPPFSSTA